MSDNPLMCPVWHRPLAGALRLIPDSLDVKCKFCGQVHVYSRADLNNYWDTLEQQKTTAEGEHTPQQSVGALA